MPAPPPVHLPNLPAKRLKAQLGVRLFNRTTSSLALTEQGTQLRIGRYQRDHYAALLEWGNGRLNGVMETKITPNLSKLTSFQMPVEEP